LRLPALGAARPDGQVVALPTSEASGVAGFEVSRDGASPWGPASTGLLEEPPVPAPPPPPGLLAPPPVVPRLVSLPPLAPPFPAPPPVPPLAPPTALDEGLCLLPPWAEDPFSESPPLLEAPADPDEVFDPLPPALALWEPATPPESSDDLVVPPTDCPLPELLQPAIAAATIAANEMRRACRSVLIGALLACPRSNLGCTAAAARGAVWSKKKRKMTATKKAAALVTAAFLADGLSLR
jgi:hypothetical protein